MLSCLQEANVPLDQRQIQWMIRKLDMNFTSMIKYRFVWNIYVYIYLFMCVPFSRKLAHSKCDVTSFVCCSDFAKIK